MQAVLPAVLPVLALIAVFFLTALIQHKRRHEDVHHCMGVDMRGIEDNKGFKQKIQWIRNRPDFHVSKDPYKILYKWEQRDTLLDAATRS